MRKNEETFSIDFCIKNIGQGIKYTNDKKLAEYELTNQQGRLLGAIFNGLRDGKNLNRKYLEDVMELKGPSVTSLLNSLEKNGFILRLATKEDGRARQIIVTEKGKQLVDEMEEVFEASEQKLLNGMTKTEKTELKRLLIMVYENISKDMDI